MNVFLENINLTSTSGPNSFAAKLVKQFINKDHNFSKNINESDVRLCFIESHIGAQEIKTVQRLDGIYFNSSQNYSRQNENIKKTYDMSDGVVFQTEFNKELTFKYFGEHKNYKIIRNGADLGFLNLAEPVQHEKLDKFENMWSCASSWRPHKRLDENIKYFLEHSGENDCLVVAGQPDIDIHYHPRIFYVGYLDPTQLASVYKRSKYFLHLAWLDHCPNVVVDARASGCQIICSSAGGTKEIAGLDAVIIEEQEWDYRPVELYSPPPLDFTKKLNNTYDIGYDMSTVADEYIQFLESVQD